MKSYLVVLILLFSQSTIFCQKTCSIKLILISNHLPDSVKIYITGNNRLMGNWNPAGAELNKVNDSTWEKIISFPLNSKIEYKFTKGNWASEALNNDKTIPGNNLLTVKNDTTIFINVKYWSNKSERKITGKITGDVEYIRGLKGKGLKPRDVIIWLPPEYKNEINKRYPVLYMQDGQNIIDPQTSAFGTDWGIDETADSLIKIGAIKKIIVVGIYNTVDRSEEYAPGDTGNAYMNFVVNTLKPLIDKKYRTLPNPENTAVGGSSLGGLIAFMLAWDYPEVFANTVCFSPAFDIDKYNFVDSVINYNGAKKKLKIFIDIGTAGLEDSLTRGVDEMIEALNDKGYKEGNELIIYKAENAKHSEYYWGMQVWRFMEFLFEKD